MQDLRDAIEADRLDDHVAEFYAKRGMEVPALK
jgi:queuine tRNA-ribosyltransferase